MGKNIRIWKWVVFYNFAIKLQNISILIMKITTTTDKIIEQKALYLALCVFMEYEAPDYGSDGIEEFKGALSNPGYIGSLCYYIAKEEKELVGMLATCNNGSHIALLFVNGKWHRKGIGRNLIEYAKSYCKSSYMTVNSAPFAHKFYQKIGFEDTDVEQTTNGVRYFPMKMNINQYTKK